MKKGLKIAIAAAAPVAAMILYACRKLILRLSYFSPICWVKASTGWYCPGCGNTRSVRALLRGDILGSLRNNITPPLLILILLLLYIELLFGIFGKEVKLLPRSLPFWMTVLGIFMAYFFARNFIGAIAPIQA